MRKQQQLPSSIEHARENGASLPRFAIDELEGPLRCGASSMDTCEERALAPLPSRLRASREGARFPLEGLALPGPREKISNRATYPGTKEQAMIAGRMHGEDELLQAWRFGDSHAGEALFIRYFDSLHQFFDARVKEGVDDLVQRTFVALIEGRDSFRGDSSFRTYVFAVARRQLFKFYASRNRGRSVSLSTMSLVDQETSITGRMARQQRCQVLARALERLPVDQRICVELYYFEEMSIAELARVVQAPEGTVKRWLWTARQALAASIATAEARGR